MAQPQPNLEEVVQMLAARVGDLTAQLALAQSVLNGYAKQDEPGPDHTPSPEG